MIPFHCWIDAFQLENVNTSQGSIRIQEDSTGINLVKHQRRPTSKEKKGTLTGYLEAS